MTEKISVNVKVISLNLTHSFLIPTDMKTEDVVQLILQTLREEYFGVRYSIVGHSLMQAAAGKLLDKACSFKQLGILQGEELILM